MNRQWRPSGGLDLRWNVLFVPSLFILLAGGSILDCRVNADGMCYGPQPMVFKRTMCLGEN